MVMVSMNVMPVTQATAKAPTHRNSHEEGENRYNKCKKRKREFRKVSEYNNLLPS